MVAFKKAMRGYIYPLTMLQQSVFQRSPPQDVTRTHLS